MHNISANPLNITPGRSPPTKKKIHPGRLTWNLRIHPSKRKIIFQTIIFRFYVNLPGCISFLSFSTVKNICKIHGVGHQKKTPWPDMHFHQKLANGRPSHFRLGSETSEAPMSQQNSHSKKGPWIILVIFGDRWLVGIYFFDKNARFCYYLPTLYKNLKNPLEKTSG